jgi:hypothetical protein
MGSLALNAVISSQSKEFSPLVLSNCRLWLDASDSNSVVGTPSAVTDWKDKSLSGYVFTRSVGSCTYITNTITITNGYFLSNVGSIDLTNFTCFIVTRQTSGNSNQPCFAARPTIGNTYASVEGFGFYTDGAQSRFFGVYPTTFITSTRTTSNNTLYTLSATSAGLMKQRDNSVPVATTVTTASRTTPALQFSLCGEATGASWGYYTQTTNFNEVIVYNRVLNSTEVTQVETYLNAKWSIY